MAKRTGDEDDRVVHGGELPGDDDEEPGNSSPDDDDTQVLSLGRITGVDPKVSERPTQILQRPQPASTLDSAPYTLAERLLWTVCNQYHAYPSPDAEKGVLYADYVSPRLSDGNVARLVKAFGPDVFKVTDLEFSRMGINVDGSRKDPSKNNEYVISGVLSMGTVAYDSFHEAAKNYLKQNLSHDDIELCFGIKQGAEVNMNDKALHKNFPDLAGLAKLCTDGRFFLPRDPYMLLLNVEPEHRKFLSLCFDNASARGSGFFGKPIDPGATEEKIKENYHFDFYYLRGLINEPLIVFEDAFKVRAQYGVNDPRPYFDALDALSAKIKGKSPLI